MNAGMELMGMKECRECGDPYTPAEPDTGVCSCCIMSHEVAALRARVAELEEGNVRRQVALEARAETAERDLDMARGIISRLGDPDSLESLWALLRYERARVAELERERDEARERVLVMSDAWKAAMDNVARLREALTQVRDAMLATGQEPDGDDDPRRPVAAAVWRALASAPSALQRNQCDGCAAGRPVDAHGMHRMSDGDGFASNYQQCQAHRYASPTPRDMRVAEAVQNAERLRCLRVGSAFINMMSPREPFGCADMSRFARAERDTPTIDLAAVVAKVTP